jgi:hypothetical protein
VLLFLIIIINVNALVISNEHYGNCTTAYDELELIAICEYGVKETGVDVNLENKYYQYNGGDHNELIFVSCNYVNGDWSEKRCSESNVGNSQMCGDVEYFCIYTSDEEHDWSDIQPCEIGDVCQEQCSETYTGCEKKKTKIWNDQTIGKRTIQDQCNGEFNNACVCTLCDLDCSEPSYTLECVENSCNAECIINQKSDCINSQGYKGLKSCLQSCNFGVCEPYEYCGDSKKNGNEFCDSDSVSCETKEGYIGDSSCLFDCSKYGSCITTEYCGDGVRTGSEQCDDGNKIDNDCCSNTCMDNEPPLSSKTKGVCIGTKKICVNQAWEDPDYLSINNYEEVEQSCDLLDNNCDGKIDEGVTLKYYEDNDNDGFGFSEVNICADMSYKYVLKTGDCDDNNENINPGEIEICGDGIDNNCDNQHDEDCDCIPMREQECGFDIGTCKKGNQVCNNDGEWGECVDSINPVTDICDSFDNDCDGQIDEDCDIDLDTYPISSLACIEKFIDGLKNIRDCPMQLDCDDSDRKAYPNHREICDSIDNDCDGQIDNIKSTFCHEILNKEPYGVCNKLAVCSNNELICDIPNFEEDESTCDGYDNDCDGVIDEGCKCTEGATKECGTGIGECTTGFQTCTNSLWGECKNSVNPSNEICDSIDNDCDGRIDEEIFETCIIEGCSGKRECVSGQFKECKAVCVDKTNIEMILTKEDISIFIDEANLEREEVDQALKTIEVVNQDTEFEYLEGKTVINNNLNVKKNMDNFSYTLFIPKCLTKYLDDLEFYNDNYTIIQEDPVIAWHFTQVSDNIDLGYEVKGQIPEACLEKIKGLPIAKVIGSKIKKKTNIFTWLIPTIIILISISLLLYISRKPHTEKKLETEQDYKDDFIIKQRQKLLSQIKDMKFSSKQQAENYMKRMGLSESNIDWILNKL